jgi:hypothetical protein
LVSISKTFRLSSSIKVVTLLDTWKDLFSFERIYYSWSQLITSHYHILNHQLWLPWNIFFYILHPQIYLGQNKKFKNPQHLCINWSISVEYIFCAPCTRLDFFSQHAFSLTGFHTLFFQFSSRLMLFAAFYVPPVWWNNAAQHKKERRIWREKLLEVAIKRRSIEIHADVGIFWGYFFNFWLFF